MHCKDCALRANRVFHTDEKRIRMENEFQWRLMREARYAVTKTRLLIKAKTAWGLVFYKIVDCVRMCFSSVRNQRSGGRLFVRATSALRNIGGAQYSEM